MEYLGTDKAVNQIEPLVSVCVQTYQHAPYIRECLDSILMQQTDSPFEIILGEDESTDGTREICIEYAEKHPDKIRLFLRSRKDVIYINGQATGRYNFIENLKAARGKYIALCEGDDYWTDPLKLQKQVDLLEEKPRFSGSFHETKQVGNLNHNKRTFGLTEKDEFTTADTITTQSPFHTSSFIFKREHLEFPEWFCDVVSSDMALFSIVSKYGPIKVFHKIMSAYRHHEGGITKTNSIKSTFHDRRIELMEYLNEFHEYQYQDKIIEVIKSHQYSIGGHKIEQVKPSTFWQAKNWLNKKLKGI